MLEAYQDYWVRAIDFSGKTSREGYWYVFLVNAVLSFVLGMILPDSLQYIWSLVNVVPAAAIGFRRIRSAGRNPFHYLWLLTIVGGLYVLYLLVQPDQDQTV